MNETIVFDTPEDISYARLAALKASVKLEKVGMKMSRGPSRTSIARKEFGLKARAPHDEVIAAIQAKMDAILQSVTF
jgi:hypothetical protein